MAGWTLLAFMVTILFGAGCAGRVGGYWGGKAGYGGLWCLCLSTWTVLTLGVVALKWTGLI